MRPADASPSGAGGRLSLGLAVLLSLVYMASFHLKPYEFSYALKASGIVVLAWAAMRHGVVRPRLFAMALAFSAVGDVVLELGHFMAGIAAFALAHICYGMFFLLLVAGGRRRAVPVVPLAGGLALFAAAMLVYLWPHLGALQIPVVVYVFLIASVAGLAVLAPFNTPWPALGMMMFMISDSLLAVNKFADPFVGADYAVWLTYFAAQYLLVIGYLKFRGQQ